MNLHEIKMHITQHVLNDKIPLILKFSIIMLSLYVDVACSLSSFAALFSEWKIFSFPAHLYLC